MNMYVQLVHEKAKMPTRAHYNDAGLDVFTPVDVTINPGEKVMINTGIKWVIPDGWVAIIKDKSGLSCNFDLTTRAGVIDAGYRGEVVIKLHNEGTEPFKFKAGEKISQVLAQAFLNVHCHFLYKLQQVFHMAQNSIFFVLEVLLPPLSVKLH